MKRLFSSLMLTLCTSLLLCGCTTSETDSTPKDNIKITTAAEPVMEKSIYISTVVDNRNFQKESKDRSVQVITEDEKDCQRVIGLKRNTLGMAIGTIHLHENQSVTGLTKDTLIKGLKNSGYKVIDKKENITGDTVIAEVRITKFWTWHTPGVWNIDINAQIENVITLKSADREDKLVIKGSGKTKKNIGTEEAYHDALGLAQEELVRDLKQKLK